jgi:hypothetical protein
MRGYHNSLPPVISALSSAHGIPSASKTQTKLVISDGNTSQYKYIVMPGNNSRIIKEAMEKRDWWVETHPFSSLYNFKWKPDSNGIRFDQLSSQTTKQVVNHYEYHNQLSAKDFLFKNLRLYAEVRLLINVLVQQRKCVYIYAYYFLCRG